MAKAITSKQRTHLLMEAVLKKMKKQSMTQEDLRDSINQDYLDKADKVSQCTIWRALSGTSEPKAELTLALHEWTTTK